MGIGSIIELLLTSNYERDRGSLSEKCFLQSIRFRTRSMKRTMRRTMKRTMRRTMKRTMKRTTTETTFKRTCLVESLVSSLPQHYDVYAPVSIFLAETGKYARWHDPIKKIITSLFFFVNYSFGRRWRRFLFVDVWRVQKSDRKVYNVNQSTCT